MRTCEVEHFQPLAVGLYWVYETNTDPVTVASHDSIVVDAMDVKGGLTQYTVLRFVNDTLQSTFMSEYMNAGAASTYLVENLPGMYNDLRTERDSYPDQRGPVLYCGTLLPPVSRYRAADSLPFLDSTGAVGWSITQYHLVTSGSFIEGTVGELSVGMPTPTPPASNTTRLVDMVVDDTLSLIEPLDAKFYNGKRYVAGHTSVRRTYIYEVGMFLETIVQDVEDGFEPGITRRSSYTRRLVKYGRR